MKNDFIFVFGSNLAGRHGAGAAKYALLHHGAVYGRGTGIQGGSYALPTKDEKLRTLQLGTIQHYVNLFIEFASANQNLDFKLTRVGCGLAGYRDEEITSLFPLVLPANIFVPPEWTGFFLLNKTWSA